MPAKARPGRTGATGGVRYGHNSAQAKRASPALLQRRTSLNATKKRQLNKKSPVTPPIFRTCDLGHCKERAPAIPAALLDRMRRRPSAKWEFAHCEYLCSKCVKKAYGMFPSQRMVQCLTTSVYDVFPSSSIYNGKAPRVLTVKLLYFSLLNLHQKTQEQIHLARVNKFKRAEACFANGAKGNDSRQSRSRAGISMFLVLPIFSSRSERKRSRGSGSRPRKKQRGRPLRFIRANQPRTPAFRRREELVLAGFRKLCKDQNVTMEYLWEVLAKEARTKNWPFSAVQAMTPHRSPGKSMICYIAFSFNNLQVSRLRTRCAFRTDLGASCASCRSSSPLSLNCANAVFCGMHV